MKKIRAFFTNLVFYIKNYRKVTKADKEFKEESLKVEKQAKRILDSDIFNDPSKEW